MSVASTPGVDSLASASPSLQVAACPLCGSTSRRGYVAFAELEFSECEACALVYKSREDAALRAEGFYEEGYYRHGGNRRLRRFRHRSRKARGLLCNALEWTEARAVLDVGCAVGEVVDAAQRLGLTGLGCDISEFAVRHCNERGLPAKVGSLEALPAAGESVDAVVMKHVLEHTLTPQRALAEARRVLRPGGVLVVAVPDLDYWKGRWWRRRGRYFRPTSLGRQHFVYYDERHLVRLLGEAGFAVRATTKAVLRRKAFAAGPLARAAECLRYAATWAWTRLARGLHLRREIVVIASRVEAR